MHLDLDSLGLFVAVVDAGSINAAAVREGRSQQAVSERMRNLESALELALLERSARGTRPTGAGELVAEWAREFLQGAATFSDRLDTLRADANAHLRVAASQTIAGYLLPNWLGALAKQHPDAAPYLLAANSADVVRAVRTGEVSVGFIETTELPADLQQRLVGHDELVVVVHPDHPWAVHRTVSAQELAHTPLVLREEGSGTRTAFERLLAGAGEDALVPPAAELSSVTAVRGAVMAGIGPSVMSALAVNDEIRSGRLVRVRVRKVQLVRPLTAIWRPQRQLPASAAALISIALQPPAVN